MEHRRSKIATVVQIVVGMVMAVFGVLKFIKPELKVKDDATLRSFINSGRLWQLIGAAEAIGGLAMASCRFVPLGLTILAPVVAGIVAFSVKTGGEELSVGVLLAVAHLWLSWQWRSSFAALFQSRRWPIVSSQRK